jgi:hypothetical protein
LLFYTKALAITMPSIEGESARPLFVIIFSIGFNGILKIYLS